MEEFISRYYDSVYSAAVLLAIFLLKAVTIFVIPQIFCYATAGMMFPPIKAMLLCIVGLLLEYTINYYAGNKLGKNALERLWAYFEGKGKKRPRLQTTIPGVFMLYVLPGASRDLLGMMAGANSMNPINFLIAAIAGSMPNLVLIVIIGSAAINPLSPQFILPLVFLVLAGAGIHLFMRRKRKE